MKRETITSMLNGLADNYISEAEIFCPDAIQEPPERIAHMKKKRFITFALAAALILALGITAFAVWNIHTVRQQELKADLKIEENSVSSYMEYDVPDEQASGLIPNIADTALVEKAIRALSLLESLVRSGCPFVFKGGTSLMLHLNSAKRLSIDIDIICPPGTDIEKYLGMYAAEYGFWNIQLVERVSRTDVPKKHAKFFYQVSFFAGHNEEKILLDVLFEDIHYNNVVTLPIASPLLKTIGEPVMAHLPSAQDLLGDKLTAFAPHTTGIPFFKGEKNCSMEITLNHFKQRTQPCHDYNISPTSGNINGDCSGGTVTFTATIQQ